MVYLELDLLSASCSMNLKRCLLIVSATHFEFVSLQVWLRGLSYMYWGRDRTSIIGRVFNVNCMRTPRRRTSEPISDPVPGLGNSSFVGHGG